MYEQISHRFVYMDRGHELNYYGKVLNDERAIDRIIEDRIIIVGESSINVNLTRVLTVITENIVNENIVNIFLEYFNFEMQFLLDDFVVGKLSFENLVQ